MRVALFVVKRGVAYSLIIFDLDGTLIDSLPDIAASLNQAIGEVGRSPLSMPEVKEIVGSGARDLVAQALGSTRGHLVDETLARYRQIYRQNPIAHSTVYPGVMETLGKLSEQSIKLAVATNKPGMIARQVVDALGLGSFFFAVLGEDDVGARKPDPKMLELLIEQAGVTQAQTLFVGDSEVDQETTVRLGADFCSVGYGYAHDQAVMKAGARYHVDHFSELVSIVR